MLTESAAIIEYLSRSFSNPQIYRPSNPESCAALSEWCYFIISELDAASLYMVRRHLRLKDIYGEAPVAVQAAKTYFAHNLEAMAPRIGIASPYLFGSKLSTADILLMTCLEWARAEQVTFPESVMKYRERVAGRFAYQAALARNFAQQQELALNTEQKRNLATEYRTEPPHSSLGYSFLEGFVEPIADSHQDSAANAYRLTADPMLAGAAHAAPASIPKPLVITGPPSVPVEGGPEKLLSECNYLGIHLSEGQDDVLISCDSGLLILALLILVLTLVVLFLTLALVLHLFQRHKQVTLVRRG